jgi:lauroyl/myristoyl acyltransferase
MTKPVAPPIVEVQRRVERDLAELPSTDPANALSGLLYDWLRDETWVAAALKIPSAERRTWLASAGEAAFANDWGGYASFLRKLTGPLEDLWPAEALVEILCRHTQWLLANVSDSLDFLHGQFDAHWDDVTVVGEEHLREAVAAGRGVMVLSAHQSHPGFGFFHPAWQELRISTVANLGDRRASHSATFLDGLRKRVELLPTTPAAIRPMLSRLRGGGCVAIYSDYLYPGTPGTLSALLGGPVLVASAAVSVALRTGATVIPLSVARNWPPGDGGVEVRFFSPLPLSELDPRAPHSHEMAALLFGLTVEGLIRRNPSVWRLWATLRHRWRLGREAVRQAT